MNTSGAYRHRQHGRLACDGGHSPLPTVWVETGPIPGDPEGPMWQLPNTQPFIEIDLRVPSNYSTTTDPTPSQTADYIVGRVQAYVGAFAEVFAAIRKPLRFGWVVKGPDSGYFDLNTPATTSLWLSKDPVDGGAVDRPVIFHFHARQHMLEWSEAVWPVVAAALVAEGLPLPEFFMTDFEGVGDNEPTAHNPPPGWFGLAVQELGPPTNLDVSTYLLDSYQQFADWYAERQTDIQGNSLPAYNTAHLATHPANHERTERARCMGEVSYLQSLEMCIYAPVRAAFGNGVRCGEWQLHSDSKDSRSETKPGRFRHWNRGVYGPDVQVPKNYGIDIWYYIRDGQNSAEGWGTTENWLKRFQLVGATSDEPREDVMLELLNRLTRGCVIANPSKTLMPSVGIEAVWDFLLGDRALAVEFRTRYMVAAARYGARDIWFFAPKWDSGSPGHITVADYRTLLYSMVRDMNKRLLAGRPYRNQMAR